MKITSKDLKWGQEFENFSRTGPGFSKWGPTFHKTVHTISKWGIKFWTLQHKGLWILKKIQNLEQFARVKLHEFQNEIKNFDNFMIFKMHMIFTFACVKLHKFQNEIKNFGNFMIFKMRCRILIMACVIMVHNFKLRSSVDKSIRKGTRFLKWALGLWKNMSKGLWFSK